MLPVIYDVIDVPLEVIQKRKKKKHFHILRWDIFCSALVV